MILVTGATGLVGSHLLVELQKQGKKFRTLKRPNSAVSGVEKFFSFYNIPAPEKSVWVDGDVTDYFSLLDAMENVVNAGTATRARIPGIAVCGKTGSVENDPLPEHSVFIAFAPKDNPKIAIAVYVEYSGMGGRAASSIAGLVIEKYLTGTISRKYIEDYVFKGDFED